MHKFYQDRNTKEVYVLGRETRRGVIIEHAVKDEAWLVQPEDLESDYKLLRGKKAKRADILYDVVLQLNSGRFKAKSCYGYVELKDSFRRKLDLEELDDVVDPDPLRFKDTVFDNNKVKPKTEVSSLVAAAPTCTVCAIGSIFVSTVDKYNKLKVSECTDDRDIVSYLEKFGFSRVELREMESFFEDSYQGNLRKKSKKMFPEVSRDEAVLKTIINYTLMNGEFNEDKFDRYIK